MTMHKRLLVFFSAILLPIVLFAAKPAKDTRVYAVKDGQELKMDIYTLPSETKMEQPCLMFVFGGGFKEGSRDAAEYTDYFTYFAERGFVVVSIDYRLGMKDAPAPGIFNTQPLRNAIAMAVSDLYSATDYVLRNAQELNIDSTRIIISGSSAGAITVLQADYEERDYKPSADVLPEKFHYAGVISFAGGIFSTEGVPSYTRGLLHQRFSFTEVPINWYLTIKRVFFVSVCSVLFRWQRVSEKKAIPTCFTVWKGWDTKWPVIR